MAKDMAESIHIQIMGCEVWDEDYPNIVSDYYVDDREYWLELYNECKGDEINE